MSILCLAHNIVGLVLVFFLWYLYYRHFKMAFISKDISWYQTVEETLIKAHLFKKKTGFIFETSRGLCGLLNPLWSQCHQCHVLPAELQQSKAHHCCVVKVFVKVRRGFISAPDSLAWANGAELSLYEIREIRASVRHFCDILRQACWQKNDVCEAVSGSDGLSLNDKLFSYINWDDLK